jgi:hypothetical protein
MDVNEFFTDAWRMLIGRVEGPFTFRFVIQPLVASFFAVRAGLKDARANRTPYLWTVFSHAADRRDLLRQGWKDVRKVFAVAIILDVIYQVVELRWVYPLQAVIVATVLAIIPYGLVRGPIARFATRVGGTSSGKPPAA